RRSSRPSAAPSPSSSRWTSRSGPRTRAIFPRCRRSKRSWFDAFGHSVSPEEAEAELEATRSEEYFGDALTRDSILVAEVNGRLLGYVQFGDVSIEEVEARPGDQELHRLYVETAEHGRGVGRALVDAALHHPRLAGASRIYLQVWERNDRAV